MYDADRATSHLHADVYERLACARAFIDACYDQPLNLGQIAGQAHFSRYHFIRLFRRVFALTPHQYLIRRRIERAKQLLAGSDLSVTEICFAVGFQSLGSFSALFRRYVGHSPAVYRARRALSVPPRRPFVPACFLMMSGVTPSSPA